MRMNMKSKLFCSHRVWSHILGVSLLMATLMGWSQRAEAACATTRVYLLLDTSGSMKGTKHSNVRTAIKNLTSSYKNQLEFGLATFGSNYQLRVGISPTGWQTINSSVDSYPSNENYTRMGTAIRSAGQYIWSIKKNEPAATKNRPYYLVLITDGYPTGESLTPTTETRNIWRNYGIKTFVIGIQFNASLLNNIAKEGQTQQAYSATNQASLNTAFNSIANKASAEACDGLDNDCDGQVDEGLSKSCSNACGTGTQQCQNAAWTACSSSQNARPEVCDGKDNDCDGKTDENWPDVGKKCSVGKGICKRDSTWRCKADQSGIECPATAGPPGKETCNGRDDDCDGRVDGITRNCSTACGSGTQFCLVAFWLSCSAPQPKTERCNGLDDDCDGQTDEDWTLKGKTCTQGGSGNCAKTGVWKCAADGNGITCAANSPNGRPETCNNQDDDCDGSVDEDFPTKGKACGSGTGGCQQNGKLVCKPDGTGVRCSSSGGQPRPETCDGLDNDCDGQTDEQLTRPCRSNCGNGTESCSGGRWIKCTAPQPVPETCDGQDNDCDGQVDNGLRRKCKSKCGDGLETCIAGQWGYCDAKKPKAEVCDNIDNDCNGKLDDVAPKDCQAKCGKGQSVCDKGAWSECKGPPPSEEKCDGQDNDCDGNVDEELTRECKSKCGTGTETCQQGAWEGCTAPTPSIDLCDGKDNDCDGKIDNGAKCPPGAVCKFGRCFLKCRNGECPAGSFCETDLCNGNLCEKVKCKGNEKCVVGRCVDPCTLGTCPQGEQCRNGRCIDPNNPGGEPNVPDGNPNGEQTTTDAGAGTDTATVSDSVTDNGGIVDYGPDISLPDINTGNNNKPPTKQPPRGGSGCLCAGTQSKTPPWALMALMLLTIFWAGTRRKRS